MIRVIFDARTGNNLFQYAAGRSLSMRHNTELTVDTSWIDPRLRAQMDEITLLPIQCKYIRRFHRLHLGLRKLFGLQSWSLHRGTVYREQSPLPDPDFHTLPDDTLIVGYFQSSFYFSHIESQLRRELDLSKLIISPESLRLEEKLRNSNVVSLHIRRGDYVRLNTTECLAVDYHQQGIRRVQEQVEGVTFCVFSDDIPWCRQQFIGKEFTFCDLPESHTSAFHDLRLMSACSHHIIVNSSYSWWGAWFNPSPKKIVIAPKYWMKDLTSEHIVQDNWIRL